MAWSRNSADWVNLHTHLRVPLWQSTRLALVFFYISSRIISSQQINWNVFIHILNYLCSQDSSHGNILLYSTGDTLITIPGSLEIHAFGDISANYITFLLVSFNTLLKWNVRRVALKAYSVLPKQMIVIISMFLCWLYWGSLKMKCWVSGA